MGYTPKPGTNAARILDFIAANPDATRNAIIKGLAMNPSPARTYLKTLESHGLVVRTKDEQGYHHYRTKARM